jgi:predicted FMN-binding regulatory protein PaiB/ribosomal protein S18 acetylase RimI-like enzyme
MYIPGLFKVTDSNAIREFIDHNGFGIIINTVNGRLWATHVPMLLTKDKDGKDILSGHLSKANSQWKEFEKSGEVLVVFPGSHSYISSSWYDHENVPTWNYLAVHVYGKIKTIDGDELKEELSKIVNKYEAVMPHPVSVERMTESFVQSEMKGIVGFKISITEIQAANKLSQNRDEKNYKRIIEGLENAGDNNSIEMAEIMKEKRKLVEKIIIRRGFQCDLLRLQRIGRTTFSETFADANTEENMQKYLDEAFSIEKITEELNNRDSQFYFAEINDKTIGYLKLNIGSSQTELKDNKALEIERIYVLKEFQGKKVGQELYEKAIQIAIDTKVDYVWLGVWENNPKAINFYKKNGFIEFDKHIFRLGDDIQTDLMMKLELKSKSV